MIKFRCLAVLLALVFTSVSKGQDLVPVVEAQIVTEDVQPMVEDLSSAPEMLSQRYDLMQDLREEVRQLRGQVEELSYQLRKVKQQQLDDYLDVDRRLSALSSADSKGFSHEVAEQSSGDVAVATSSDAEASIEDPVSSVLDVEQSGRDFYEAAVKEDYTAASNKLLKDRDIEGAASALQIHLDSYPESPFAANAHYWLGEIYLLRGDVELARQAFETIIGLYPTHPKAMDSHFKLGKIVFELGDTDKARILLETAAASSGGVAAKAQKYIDQNF
jgi:tol-pal system protein YbgF